MIQATNFVEQVRHFNLLAGNTDTGFNVRQTALYIGMQLEELAEKMAHLKLTGLAENMQLVGNWLKEGVFDQAVIEADRKALLDDDVDQIVVTIGSMLSMGADIHGAFAEVHRANMSKVFPDGTLHKNSTGKIIKPEGFSGPDLSPFVVSGLIQCATGCGEYAPVLGKDEGEDHLCPKCAQFA